MEEVREVASPRTVEEALPRSGFDLGCRMLGDPGRGRTVCNTGISLNTRDGV